MFATLMDPAVLASLFGITLIQIALGADNLIIITIPVFLNGAPYRMPVRFRYRKAGSAVKFTLSIYNPERAFEAAFDEALKIAEEATELPIFRGHPETA